MADQRTRYLITPPIHTSGKYSLFDPYTVDLDMIYRCHAVRSFDELVKRNINVYEEYYKPKGLPTSIYKEDAAKGASIVTLLSAEGEYYYVPNTFIESYPGMTGLRYERKCLILDLGPLPSTFNLDYLIPQMQDVVKKGVGVEEQQANIVYTTIPMTTTVSHEDHVQLEATRRAAIQLHTPLDVQLAEANAANVLLQEQVDMLLQVIADHEEIINPPDDA